MGDDVSREPGRVKAGDGVSCWRWPRSGMAEMVSRLLRKVPLSTQVMMVTDRVFHREGK